MERADAKTRIAAAGPAGRSEPSIPVSGLPGRCRAGIDNARASAIDGASAAPDGGALVKGH